jgi:hypothetical protein
MEWAPGEAVGAPDHPHRGFETISYVLAGEKLHEDSTGDRQTLGPGDVQWMTAGSGIVHSEMPSPAMRAAGGRSHSFQIWVNLPRRHKMAEQRYQFVAHDRIPLGESADGLVAVRVIAGQAYGAKARIDTYTPVTLQDWTMLPGAQARPSPPPEQQMALYLFQGTLAVGPRGQAVDAGELVIFTDGGDIELNHDGRLGGPARFLLFGGVPIGEPIARYGPFVMNTREELMQAFDDYRAGRMGEIKR